MLAHVLHVPPFLPALVFPAALLLVAGPALSANDIYKYVDDDGAPHFTDQWQLIPEKFRDRIQTLDPETGKPVTPGTLRPAPVLSRKAPPPPSVAKEQAAPAPEAAPPFYAAWLDKFSQLSIPLPSRYQTGIGLMTIVLVVGAFKIIRVSANPLVKLMLKGVITVLLVGSAYAMYLSKLNEQISHAIGAPASQEITGKELLREMEGTTERVKGAVRDKALAPLEKVRDATVGEVYRTRDLANQSNQQKGQTLRQIDPVP